MQENRYEHIGSTIVNNTVICSTMNKAIIGEPRMKLNGLVIFILMIVVFVVGYGSSWMINNPGCTQEYLAQVPLIGRYAGKTPERKSELDPQNTSSQRSEDSQSAANRKSTRYSTDGSPQLVQATVGTNFVTDVYKSVGPAVVNVTTTKYLYDFWSGRPVPQGEVGSGFIFDSRGYIMTNHHVVAQADELRVVLSDGTDIPAKVIGSDEVFDLAILKVEPGKHKLPTAKLGMSSKLQIGEWVVAIGNPMGLDQSVTAGVISAMNRNMRTPSGVVAKNMIQTDASINPGNSGGPLLNALGQVIGINTFIISQSGGSEGLGFAIPIDTAKKVADELIQFGTVIRPWLGVEVMELTSTIAKRINAPVERGVLIISVYESSPAARANMLPILRNNSTGEIIYYIVNQVDGKAITSQDQLQLYIRGKRPGDSVTISGYKNSKKFSQKIQLETLPSKAKGRALLSVI